jgi:hypothetical protein
MSEIGAGRFFSPLKMGNPNKTKGLTAQARKMQSWERSTYYEQCRLIVLGDFAPFRKGKLLIDKIEAAKYVLHYQKKRPRADIKRGEVTISNSTKVKFIEKEVLEKIILDRTNGETKEMAKRMPLIENSVYMTIL